MSELLKSIVRIMINIKSRLFFSLYPHYISRRNAVLKIGHKSFLTAGKIRLGQNAVLRIGNNVNISGNIYLGNGSIFSIADSVNIENYNITVGDHSTLELSEGVIISAPKSSKGQIDIASGSIVIDKFSFVKANLFVRFGGELRIGKYTGFSDGTEIVCDERIMIGDYCMLSYNLNIYDTNSHSTDWKKRRVALENKGAETEKPDTKPVIIGNDVWIGKNASIIKGAVIGERCIVGLGTLVSEGNYEPDSILIGSSLKVISRK